MVCKEDVVFMNREWCADVCQSSQRGKELATCYRTVRGASFFPSETVAMWFG